MNGGSQTLLQLNIISEQQMPKTTSCSAACWISLCSHQMKSKCLQPFSIADWIILMNLTIIRFRLMIYFSSNYRTHGIHYKLENIAGIQSGCHCRSFVLWSGVHILFFSVVIFYLWRQDDETLNSPIWWSDDQNQMEILNQLSSRSVVWNRSCWFKYFAQFDTNLLVAFVVSWGQY